MCVCGCIYIVSDIFMQFVKPSCIKKEARLAMFHASYVAKNVWNGSCVQMVMHVKVLFH